MPVPLMCIVSQSHTVGLVCEKLSLGFLLGRLLRESIFTRQRMLFIQFTPKSVIIFFVFCGFSLFCHFLLVFNLLFVKINKSINKFKKNKKNKRIFQH